MMALSFPFVLLALLLGGENSLSGYVNFEQYWAGQGIEYKVDAFSQLLQEESAPDLQLIRKSIEQLSADTYQEREAATRALQEIGLPAQAQLETAGRSKDPEVAQRAKAVLRQLKAQSAEEESFDKSMVLLSLSRMEDPAAAALLKKIAARPEEDTLQALAASLLEKPGRLAEALPESRKILSGFSPDTRMIAQLIPGKQGFAELKQQVLESAGLQRILVQILEKTGDITLHRISGGLTEGLFTGQSGRISLRVELDCDRQRLMEEFKKNRFAIHELDNLVLLRRDEMTLYLPDNRNACVFIDLNQGDAIGFEEAKAFFQGKPDLQFSTSLQSELAKVPPDASLRGAGEFSQEMMKNLDEFSGLRHANFGLEKIGADLKLSMNLSTPDAETAENFLKYLISQQKEIVSKLQEDGDGLPPVLNSLQTLEVTSKGAEVNAVTQITKEMLGGTLELFDRIQLRRNPDRNRLQMEMQMRRQIQLNGGNVRGGVIVF